MKHITPPGKPHFRYIGMNRSDVEILFDKPNPEGYPILFSEFDELREESKQLNPDYETSIDDKLKILQNKIRERLDCQISRGMRTAYEDTLDLIKELREEDR